MPSKSLQTSLVTEPSTSNTKSIKPDNVAKKVVAKDKNTTENSFLSALKTDVAKNQGLKYPVLLKTDTLSNLRSRADKKSLYNIIKLKRSKNISQIICPELYLDRNQSIEAFRAFILGVDNKRIFDVVQEIDWLESETRKSLISFNSFYHIGSYRNRLPPMVLNLKAELSTSDAGKNLKKILNCLATRRFNLKHISLNLYGCILVESSLKSLIEAMRSKIINTKSFYLKMDSCPMVDEFSVVELAKALFVRRPDLAKLQINIINSLIKKRNF